MMATFFGFTQFYAYGKKKELLKNALLRVVYNILRFMLSDFFITRAIVRRAYVRTLGLKAFADESCSEFKAFVRIYINRVMITRTRETMMNEANI